MEKNRSPTQNRKLLNPGACTQLKEVPERPLPQEGEDFPLRLFDSLESDSDSLIQEREYQLELQHRIQDNEEMVTLEDTEYDVNNGEEDEWNLYDSLEDMEDEQYEEQIEPEHKVNNNISLQTTDRYANLRYNPNWRNTRAGAKILMSKQNYESLHDSLENLLQESNELLEKTEGRYNEHQDKVEQKRQTNKARAVGFSLRDDDNVEKQLKRKRPSSPYIKCEASMQEEYESLGSSGFCDLQNDRKIKSNTIVAEVSQENHEEYQSHDEDNCEMFSDSECEYLDSLEQKRQTDKSQGVKFRLRESNNVQKQSERKHLPSYYKNEQSAQDCESLDSPRFYIDTIKSDLENNKKTGTRKFLIKEPKDKHEKDEDHNEEDDYESLNDHFQKEYQQFMEHESTCSDMSIKSVRHSNNRVISHGRKLQTKVRVQDDIVERNKQTLGRHKINSYQLLYSEKKEVKGTQQLSSAKSSKCVNTHESVQHVLDGEESSTIEVKWKQKAQKLQYGKTEHGQMLNPNYHQGAYARTLAPGLCSNSHLQRTDIAAGNSQSYSMNQEKMTKEDHSQFEKEYGNSRFPPLSFLPPYHLVQSPSTRLIQQMEHIYEGTPRPLHTHPSSHLVLPPIGLMGDSDSELEQTRPNEKKAVTLSRCNSDGYLAQMEKINKLKENNKYKPYTLRDYKSLKQDVKLGGLGPDYKSAQEKTEKMKRQKEYATQVKNQNMKLGSKPSPSQLKPPPGIENKTNSRRKMALEYARNIQKPKPLAAKPGDANEKSERGEFPEHSQYAQLDPSHNILLAMLQQRHEKEKQIVARFTAMHVS
ncbi:jhy protein homolog isoform X2 [Chiloscyllium punctatum]|uniref:jhy protein homolog isoform X2 n=1 Tax=Chiloscyllium punctatum TaxID=137246 RepID=UPI003B634ED1